MGTLNLSKVAAGGMAAATSAILGSYFGAFGTVGGAAAGSVATAVATQLYQRSLERTRDSMRARVRPVVSLSEQKTVRLAAAKESARRGRARRSIKGLVIATILIFVLGLASVTGLEAMKGSLLLSGSTHGTSVGRVLEPSSGPRDEEHDRDRSRSDRHSSDEDRSGRDSTDNGDEDGSAPPGRPGTPTPESPGSGSPDQGGLLSHLLGPGVQH
jgi:hypothetical protein